MKVLKKEYCTICKKSVKNLLFHNMTRYHYRKAIKIRYVSSSRSDFILNRVGK